MSGVLTGLSMMWVIIGVGYLLARLGLFSVEAAEILTRFVYYVASPCLLFSILARTEIRTVLGAPLAIAAVCGLCAAAVYSLVELWAFRDSPAERAIGAMSSGLANAGFLGIPLATYVLGSAVHVTPVLIFQLGFFTPTFFVLADLTSGRHPPSVASVLKVIVKNPLLMAAAAGAAVSLSGLRLPAPVFEPVKVLSAATVPCILVAFGISLVDQGEESLRAFAPQVTLATACKVLVQPVLAYLAGRYLFGLHGPALFAVVTMAALPTAQNAYVAAYRAGAGSGIARGTVLATTLLTTPVMMLITALLAHAI